MGTTPTIPMDEVTIPVQRRRARRPAAPPSALSRDEVLARTRGAIGAAIPEAQGAPPIEEDDDLSVSPLAQPAASARARSSSDMMGLMPRQLPPGPLAAVRPEEQDTERDDLTQPVIAGARRMQLEQPQLRPQPFQGFHLTQQPDDEDDLAASPAQDVRRRPMEMAGASPLARLRDAGTPATFAQGVQAPPAGAELDEEEDDLAMAPGTEPAPTWEPDPEPEAEAEDDDLSTSPVSDRAAQDAARLERARRVQRAGLIAGGVTGGLGAILGLVGAARGNEGLSGAGMGMLQGGSEMAAQRPVDAIEEEIAQRNASEQEAAMQRAEMEGRAEDRQIRQQMLAAQLQAQGLQGQQVQMEMDRQRRQDEQSANAALGMYRQYRGLLQSVPEGDRGNWDIPIDEWPSDPEEARRMFEALRGGFQMDRRGVRWIGGVSPRMRGMGGGGSGGGVARPAPRAPGAVPSTRDQGDAIVRREFRDPEELMIARAAVAAGHDPSTPDGLDAIRADVMAYNQAPAAQQAAILQRARDRMEGRTGRTPEIQAQVERLQDPFDRVTRAITDLNGTYGLVNGMSREQLEQVAATLSFSNGHATILGELENLDLTPEQASLVKRIQRTFNRVLSQQAGANVTASELRRVSAAVLGVQGVLNANGLLEMLDELSEAAELDLGSMQDTFPDALDELMDTRRRRLSGGAR